MYQYMYIYDYDRIACNPENPFFSPIFLYTVFCTKSPVLATVVVSSFHGSHIKLFFLFGKTILKLLKLKRAI